jgi:hypothetical protein
VRRPLLVTTIVLALATAAVLTSAAWLLPFTDARSAAVSTRIAEEDVAQWFYDAVNVAIATGKLTPLQTVVAPDFVTTNALSPVQSGRAGLEAALAHLHATIPTLRLEPEIVVAGGGQVMVQVAVTGDRGGSFLGVLLMAQPRPWSAVDVLGVTDGRVVERRGLLDGTGLLLPIASSPVHMSGPAYRVVTVERIVLAAGERYDGDAFVAAHALLAEAGHIQVASTPPPGEPATNATSPATPGISVALWPTELVEIPVDHRYTVTNTGAADAVLLRITIAFPGGGEATRWGPGPVTDEPVSRTLAGDLALHLPDGPLNVAVGRVVLGPGATLSLDLGTYAALLAVDGGSLGATLTQAAQVRRGIDGAQAAIESAIVGPGDGLAVEPDTALVLRNDGSSPAEALLITVVGRPVPGSFH